MPDQHRFHRSGGCPAFSGTGRNWRSVARIFYSGDFRAGPLVAHLRHRHLRARSLPTTCGVRYGRPRSVVTYTRSALLAGCVLKVLEMDSEAPAPARGVSFTHRCRSSPRRLRARRHPRSSSSSSGASGSTINSNGPMPRDVRILLQQLALTLASRSSGTLIGSVAFVLELFLHLLERLRQSIARGEHLDRFSPRSSRRGSPS